MQLPTAGFTQGEKLFSRNRIALATVLFAAAGVRTPAESVPANLFSAEGKGIEQVYTWQTTPVAGGAELVTLVRHTNSGLGAGVPVVSVLRDSLPNGPENTARLRYIWLLTYRSPNLGQKLLSAIPFFFWRMGQNGDDRWRKTPQPLADLSQPAHRVWRTAGRDLLQWTALDPMTMPVRATSRAYRRNGSEHERLHIETALSFLEEAPVSTDRQGLSDEELGNVIARLTLTKNLLGGLVGKDRLQKVAESRDMQRAESVGRNWELVRTSAERAGLVFEPMALEHGEEEYASVWLPLGETFSAPGLSLETTWKLLHIADPWNDPQFGNWKGYVQTRWQDQNGALLPPGITGVKQVQLAPLAVYCLSYPKAPLLVVDFRSSFRPRRHEMIQRTSDELVSGILGISHFGNWYYFAGNSAYELVKARHGSAEDTGERLDAFSRFRVGLAFERSLDPEFRAQLEKGVEALSVNPLTTAIDEDIAAGRHNFAVLEASAMDPAQLPRRLDQDRRAELAAYGQNGRSRLLAGALHYASFGGYTRRAPHSIDNLDQLTQIRETQALTAYLQRVAAAGARPEVSFPAEKISASVENLSALLAGQKDVRLRQRAVAALKTIRLNTKDVLLEAQCGRAVAFAEREEQQLQTAGNASPQSEESANPAEVSETINDTK